MEELKNALQTIYEAKTNGGVININDEAMKMLIICNKLKTIAIEEKKLKLYDQREKFSQLVKKELNPSDQIAAAYDVVYALYTEKITMLEWVLNDLLQFTKEFPSKGDWNTGATPNAKLNVTRTDVTEKVSGSLLTDKQSYEIAQRFYGYCYMQQDDSLAIGAKAIPLIFDECLKMLASNGR